jgi:hypothetical protein
LALLNWKEGIAMTDRMVSLQDAFMSLYRENVLPMFRFHLARCGDWNQAQALTTATFEAALRWFDPRKEKEGERRSWLYEIAVGIPSNGTDSGINEDAPTQDQMAQFARISALHEQWKKLPKKHADVLMLALFAGLRIFEIEKITHQNEVIIVAWLSDLSLHEEDETSDTLRDLVKDIRFVGYFSAVLENELREQSATHNRSPRLRFGWVRLRFSYLAGPVMMVFSQVLPLLVLIGGVAWGLQTFTHVEQAQTVDYQESRATRGGPVDLSMFPLSTDSIILADDSGALYSLSLADNKRQNILPAGMYTPGDDALGFSPMISPDAHWLSVARTKSDGTWLYALDGSARTQISKYPVKLTWSPDGRQVAFANPNAGREILVYDITRNQQRVLIQLDGMIKAISWSPDGKSIAGEIYLPQSQEGSNTNTVIVKVGRVDVARLQWQELYSIENQPETSLIEPMLMWTVEGDELWAPAYHASIWMKDLSIHVLTEKPFSDPYGVRAALFDLPTGNTPANGQVLALSPDGVKLAIMNNHTDGSPGIVSVQLDEQPGQNLWIKNFGAVGWMSWTGDGLNLILGAKQEALGDLYRVDAVTGNDQKIAKKVQLLGTQSELLNAALNRAPKVELKHIPGTPDKLTWIVAQTVPIKGVYYRVPLEWKVWRSENLTGDVGGIEMTNFDFSSPFGFASLGDEDVSIWVGSSTGGDRMTRNWLEEYARNTMPGTFRYEPVTVAGVDGYRVFFTGPEHSLVTEVVAIPYGEAEINFTLTSYSWDRNPVLEKMLQSVRLFPLTRDGAAQATPVN